MSKTKVLLSLLAVFAVAAPAYAGGNACFTWNCDASTGYCVFDAGCSSADPYVWKYNMDFGDGTSTGLTGNSTFSHQYASGVYEANASLTIYFFSEPESDSASCTINTRLVPIGPQPPEGWFEGTCN